MIKKEMSQLSTRFSRNSACQNHWNFIEHDNVNQTHLNRGGLHLSKSGTALLAQNFRNYID